MRQFVGGQSNPTYHLHTPSRAYVLRKKPAGKLLRSAHAVDREFAVMRALQGSGVPVPVMRLLCEDESVLGQMFYVMDYVEGRVFTDRLVPGLDPGHRAAMYDDMNRVLAQLHQVDWRGVGLQDFGRPDNYCARQVERWELTTIGHPFADLAYNCLGYYLPHLNGRGFGDANLAALGIPSEHDYLAQYAARTGRAAIPDWEFYVVLSLFRTAAILVGVHRRAIEGNAADGRAVGAEIYTVVAERAWAIAQRLGA